ncbi:MAG: 50S ribosomal protein L15 [Rickettsiales bacterium]|jgi:large subunit ribosomal protein L15|nr:50S ribosomal protein L15 [Rickettsiales bacterium]
MKLNALMDNIGARKAVKRVGRGMASGTGKTAGRGHKGAKARSGSKNERTFEGGQTPFYARLPKIGFKNINAKHYAEINLGDLEKWVAAKRIDAKNITVDTLIAAKILHKKLDGLKVLAKGELKSAVNIVATKWSAAAEKAIVAAGGSIKK